MSPIDLDKITESNEPTSVTLTQTQWVEIAWAIDHILERTGPTVISLKVLREARDALEEQLT